MPHYTNNSSTASAISTTPGRNLDHGLVCEQVPTVSYERAHGHHQAHPPLHRWDPALWLLRRAGQGDTVTARLQ
jgi:hypothetical protein